MKIKYACPYWGSDRFTPQVFIDTVISSGYNGAEVFLQPHDGFCTDFMQALQQTRAAHPDFIFIALQLAFPQNEPVDAYITKMENNFLQLAALEPDFINSHTGKDYYSFDENCRVIEAAMNIGAKTGVRILHETHRGRFSFHAASLLPYLKQFPEMELVADFSHFCTVSESMLEDQEDILEQIIPHVAHVHARIGFEQGPQVNHPAAPEWENHLARFINWWKKIAIYKKAAGAELLTFSPEFGPVPYMPVQPFTQEPLSNQWDNNLFMLQTLKKEMEMFG